MTDPAELLRSIDSVLVIDYPTRDVPESLARAGYAVTVHGGPEPDNYSVFERDGEEVVERRVGRAPEHADLVYSHRPVDELSEIAAFAASLGARAVWSHSGRSEGGVRDISGCWMTDDDAAQARRAVESAGLGYVDAPYIVDAVRGLSAH